jgi:hypothetical protein
MSENSWKPLEIVLKSGNPVKLRVSQSDVKNL